MKKTLMVLSFALCASIAFAQTNRVSVANRGNLPVASVNTDNHEVVSAGYSGSIFTKDVTLFTCDFSAADESSNKFTTASMTAEDSAKYVNSGTSSYGAGTVVPVHTSNKWYCQWHRIPDTNSSTLTTSLMQEHYPVTIAGSAYYIGNFAPYMAEAGASVTNGFMYMSMIDNYTGWGGDGDNNVYDSYIQFESFATTDASMVRVHFYQLYRAFNADACFIDYSTDGGTTWRAVEFNHQIAGNSGVYGARKSVTLPAATGNQASLTLRLRWADLSGSKNGGYVFYVDDFSATDVPDYSRQLVSNQYFEGFYPMMPQNFQVPVVWAMQFINDGVQPLTNVKGHIYTYADGQAATELVATPSGVTAPADVESNFSIVIDPNGWYSKDSSYHGWAFTNNHYGPAAYLPTQNTGKNHFFSDWTTDQFSGHVYGDTATFDTIRYDVNWSNMDGHQYGVWGRDNGVIRTGAYYASGLVSSTTFSIDPDETMWNQTNYGVYVSYVTGNEVPAGWKILGMEMVASTEDGMHAVNSRIEPALRYDSAAGNSMYFKDVETGASTHTVLANEVIANNQVIYDNDGFMLNGDYNTIRIMFPEQPTLYPNKAYRVGYHLAEEADFAVAVATNYCVRGDSTEYFYNIEGMESYGHMLPISNRYTTLVYDPYPGGGWNFYSAPSTYPMIRMLVGPGYYIPKTTISYECENPDLGIFQDGAYNDICGQMDSIAIGGAKSVYVMPAEGYEIDEVTVNGVAVDENSGLNIYVEDDGSQYGVLRFDNVTEAIVARCSFKEKVGFDPVANDVRMKLQPNPATSNVAISLKGVSGMVSMSLIDMSGRVVSTSQFNAENGTNINVSNLAKGAYFVRITNSKFSKVEKLIVR